MKKFVTTLFIWALILPVAAWAHDPDQISYHFTKADNAGSLTVHFTPKSALDLLISMRAEFDENAIIRLTDYQEDFTQYFNETIQLQLNGKEISLQFNTAEFGGHDASINFKLVGFDGSYEGLELRLSSFTEIYRRTSNHLFIPDHQEVVLNLTNQYYSSINTKTGSADLGFINVPTGLMMVVIALALVIGFRARSAKKKTQVAAE